MTGTPTIYDTVPYYSAARTASCIDRIAAVGRLLALPTADPNNARVLELGCGDGGNLIPMAYSFPGSEFLGFDLASSAVARGNEAARLAGVRNVRLAQGDISELDEASLGKFDYIIAHGVYSWVPAAVRVALLRIIRNHLDANGLAFVSYNALPGDHIRGVVRQMMRMHTAGIADPERKLQQARALLDLLSRVPGAAGDVYRPLLQSEVGRALQASDELLFHDDLADISQPFFFTEFMGAAKAAGLQFAAEAVFHSMNIDALPDDIAGLLRDLAGRDLIAKEQYLDFLTCRGFRQTLLCQEEANLDRAVDTDRIRHFRFFTEAQRHDEAGEIPEFRHRNGSALRTDDPVTLRAMERLVGAAPFSIPFDDLAASSGAGTESKVEGLAAALFSAFSAGVVELRIFEPAVALEAGPRPVASQWARQNRSKGRVVNLYHEMIQLDASGQAVLPLLDGTRGVEEIGRDSGLDRATVTQTLAELAHLGLLIDSPTA